MTETPHIEKVDPETLVLRARPRRVVIGLSTLLGVTALGGGGDDSDLVKVLRESTRDTANQAGQRIVDRSLNVQPTLKVRPGWPLRVIVHKDLILKPYGA